MIQRVLRTGRKPQIFPLSTLQTRPPLSIRLAIPTPTLQPTQADILRTTPMPPTVQHPLGILALVVRLLAGSMSRRTRIPTPGLVTRTLATAPTCPTERTRPTRTRRATVSTTDRPCPADIQGSPPQALGIRVHPQPQPHTQTLLQPAPTKAPP
jgi:hypothetical protein